MSSKYGNLPDIDTAPDVYETDDVQDLPRPSSRAGASSRSRDDGKDANTNRVDANATRNEAIDTEGISVSDASKRFQTSTLVDGKAADFSGALRRKPRAPALIYPTTGSFETETYELAGYSGTSGGAGPSTSESRVDRLRRLRWEIEQLEKDVSSSSAAAGETLRAPGSDTIEAGSSTNSKKHFKEIPPAAILEQLNGLASSLSKVEAASLDANAANSIDGRTEWSGATRELLRRIQQLPLDGKETSDEATGSTAENHGKSHINEAGAANSWQQLEANVTALEKYIGVRDILSDEANGLQRPLAISVSRLEHQLTLLTQPRHLDAISRRVKVLTTELERMHEAKRKAPNYSAGGADGNSKREGSTSRSNADGTSTAGELDVETSQRLAALFSMQQRMEPLLPLASSLLARMRSLASLHASSSSFSGKLDQVVNADDHLKAGQEEVKTILKEVEGSLERNQTTLIGNLEAVEKRMESLVDRIEKLR